MGINKRGAIEIQFNWIFILIIGAIILLFFFGIVRTQKTISDVKISTTVRQDIKSILTGAGVSTGTTSLVEMPKTKIDYTCEGYSIKGTSYFKPLVSFSPSSIEDFQLMMWALDWGIGYRVSNFLYITSPNIRYILVFKSDDPKQHTFVDIINETLPSRYIEEGQNTKILMNKEKAKLIGTELKDLQDNDFEDKNNYKVKFVFFDQDPTTVDISQLTTQDEDITAINIIPNEDCNENLDCFGEIEFYISKNNRFELDDISYYIKLPSLIGAIFADLETYDCNMENAFERLDLLTQIYTKKAEALEDYYTETANYQCIAVMTQIKKYLEDIIKDSAEFDSDSIEKIYDNLIKLEDYNDRAIKLSCAELY